MSTIACGNCGAPMRVLQLAGHYGQQVEIDLCAPCHLVWFDVVESARLAGPGLLDLVGAMARAQTLAHQALRADAACPRCRGRLHEVHNQTRWGRSRQLECGHRHGAYQTFGQFLAEKGLVRPMSSADRARVLARDGALHCLNCGGAIGAGDAACTWCAAAPALLDVARLANALDPEGATRDHALHAAGARRTALDCAACGAPQPAEGGWACAQCGATLVAPGLAEAHRQVSALGPTLRAHAERPLPHVVRERLARQDAGLQRQRQRAAEMQAEADTQTGRIRPDPEPGSIELPWWGWLVVAAAVMAFVRWG